MAEGNITFVSAGVGNWKTAHCVKLICAYLSRGGVVVTNIDLKLDPWHSERYDKDYRGLRFILRRFYKWELQEGQIVTIPHEDTLNFFRYCPKGTVKTPTLVILDELLQFANALKGKEIEKKNAETIKHLTEVRKANLDIILITQIFSRVAKPFRDIGSELWVPFDLSRFDIPLLPFKIGIPGFYSVSTCSLQEGEKRGDSKPRFLGKDTSVYECYDTSESYSGLMDMLTEPPTIGDGSLKDKEQPMWVKIAASLALICSLISVTMAFKKADPVSAGVDIVALREAVKSSASVVATNEAPPVQIIVARGWAWGVVRGQEMADVGYGYMVRKGDLLPEGTVTMVTDRACYVKGYNDDTIVFVAPRPGAFQTEVKEEVFVVGR